MTSKKVFAGSLAVVFLAGLFAGIVALSMLQTYEEVQAWHVNLTIQGRAYTGRVTVLITRKDGTTETLETDNVVVTIGLNRARDHLLGNASGASNVTDDISLSNDTSPSAAWTVLPDEFTSANFAEHYNLSRNDGTVTVNSQVQYETTYTWVANASVTDLNCAGLHSFNGEGSDNNLFAAVQFPSTISLDEDDTLQVTWTITLSSG